MKKNYLVYFLLFITHPVFSASEGQLGEAMVNPGYYEKPAWFKDSFLELKEDLDEANVNKRQIILYFHQDGCPYCKKLIDDNFSEKRIVDKMSEHFDLLAINMWGDKTVTLFDGKEVSEKEFSKQMKIMFTPTLVILDKKGKPQLRMNGYYSPDKFLATLDSVRPPLNKDSTVSQVNKKPGRIPLLQAKNKEKFIYKGSDLKQFISHSKKPVMILFEQGDCLECNELHGDIFRRLPVYQQLQKFSIAQVDINSEETLVAPGGQTLTQKGFAKQLNIQYTPSILFYASGEPPTDQSLIFRSEAYLKSFHVQAVFDYILSKAYLTEPEFQRFVQRRADKMEEDGVKVELWD
ncbi:MAG: thioredoxin fold domain-containing protein [Gammaproteobacteria bacterium]|nr:thioredoxin fold domain-containing protein [Gammaproteobacteria bacterium]